MWDNDPRKNCEGYPDPTNYEATRNIERDKKRRQRKERARKEMERKAIKRQEMEEHDRFNELLNTIFYICDLAGFRVDNRIVLEDVRTGRIWK